MLEEKIAPNGVGTATPPAKFFPPRTVWQLLQLMLYKGRIERLRCRRIDGGKCRLPRDYKSSRCAADKQRRHNPTDDPRFFHPSQRLFRSS
jgi:hypothetical protein